MGRLPWDNEESARTLVGSMLGGTIVERDPGGGPEQLHDFDVRFADGTTIAFEVTRFTDSERERTMSHIERLDWHFPGLACDWHLGLVPVFDVAKLHREVARLLEAFEATDIDSAVLGYRGAPSGLPDGVAKRLVELGVRLVYSLGPPASPPAFVEVGEASVVGSTASAVLLEVAEYHANLPIQLQRVPRFRSHSSGAHRRGLAGRRV
jgi:hypothetical protein